MNRETCRKCAGENYTHHASFCPYRDEDSGEKKLPIKPSDPNDKAKCVYCGEVVTSAEFLEAHTLNKCGGQDEY